MPRHRQQTRRKHIRLTHEAEDAVRSWAEAQGVSFSAAIEALARIGLMQPLDEALAPAIVPLCGSRCSASSIDLPL